ncbi:MAG: AAA family ATPase [Theionarchaea archaeon]|nr:AAA family ATPase [Theionarchaea archaeon]
MLNSKKLEDDYMSSKEMNLFVRALQAAGQSETDAKILSFLITNDVSSANDIIEACGLSKATVYTSLQKLQDYGFVIDTGTRPAKYQVTKELIDNLRTEMQGLSKFIIKRVEEIKVPETREILESIRNVFEINGFIFERPKRMEALRGRRYLSSILFYDYIAHREFSIGIVLLDKNKIEKLKLEDDLLIISRMFDSMRRLNEEYQLITTFLFLHADLPQISRIKRNLDRSKKYLSTEKLSEKPLCIFFSNEENFKNRTVKSINDLHDRKLIVDEIVKEIKSKLEQIDEYTLVSKMYDRLVSNFITDEYPGMHDAEKRLVDRIIEPIQSMVGRETRNLAIFSRRYMELAVKIYGYIDSIERKVLLPRTSYLENDLKQLNFLISKFRPIEYELRRIYPELHRLLASDNLNPFIFTEPYDLEKNVVNQEKMKETAEDFSNTIKKGLPNFVRFIVGEAGIGKTKILKHVFRSRLEERGIRTIYVDCPVSFDLTNCIRDELTREENFPPDMRSIVRSYRRQKLETPRDVLHLLEEITEVTMKMKSNGFVVIIDELENTLPYISRVDRSLSSQRPLALRQLSEILENRTHKNLGFLIGCRKGIFSQVEENLGITNLEKFAYNLENLDFKDVKELIEIRYKVWSIENGTKFNKASINEIIKKTNANTRDIIKYLRELYSYSQQEKKLNITKSDIEKIGEIPLFRY